MTKLIVLGVILLVVPATPWRLLPVAARTIVCAAAVNLIVLFSIPVTSASSPLHRISSVLVIASPALGLVLVAVGLWLRHRAPPDERKARFWIGPLLLAAFPALLLVGLGALWWMVSLRG